MASKKRNDGHLWSIHGVVQNTFHLDLGHTRCWTRQIPSFEKISNPKKTIKMLRRATQSARRGLTNKFVRPEVFVSFQTRNKVWIHSSAYTTSFFSDSLIMWNSLTQHWMQRWKKLILSSLTSLNMKSIVNTEVFNSFHQRYCTITNNSHTTSTHTATTYLEFHQFCSITSTRFRHAKQI